jgi:hypothetical protein
VLESYALPRDVFTFGDCILPLADRVAAHQKWAAEVRDPAEKGAKIEKLEVPGAKAEYAVAQLTKNGAVKISCAYTCGDYFGASSPWEEKETRQACIDAFLEDARRHFGRELHADVFERHKAARTMILAQLKQRGD